MDQQVTITFDLVAAITWIIVGLLAGTVAAAILRDRLGFFGNIVVGLIGAFIGGALFSLLHLTIPLSFVQAIAPFIIDFIVAFVGAFLLLLVVNSIFRRRY